MDQWELQRAIDIDQYFKNHMSFDIPKIDLESPLK